MAYFTDDNFESIDFTDQSLPNGEYENCHFSNCIFNGCDLSEIAFSNSDFENCDLSNAQLKGTAFRDARFSHCKLLGLSFEICNPFLLAISFTNCLLDYSSFNQLSIKNTCFVGCQLQEVDFTEADLSGANFKEANLYKTIFENTQLQDADFRTAVHFSIDPSRNAVKGARFSKENLMGLVDKFQIIVE